MAPAGGERLNLSAYVSESGEPWRLVATDSIAMAPSILVGLAVSSHRNGTLASATFDQVAVVD